jgi:hypothetical protein
MLPLAQEGIKEGKQSTYTLREETEEQKLFEVNDSIRRLLQGMEENAQALEKKDENEA